VLVDLDELHAERVELLGGEGEPDFVTVIITRETNTKPM
jgi:hypothetical protein